MSIQTIKQGHIRAANNRKKVISGCKQSKYKVPMLYDREKIKELLTKGLSLSAVAKIIGCSTWPVQVVNKEMKSKGEL